MRRGGPRRRYGEEEREVLKAIWLAAEQPCGKRLKEALRLWLPHYEKEKAEVTPLVRQRLGTISAATIDRLLASCRVELGKRGCFGTRPGTLLRTQIPVRTEHWDVAGPGSRHGGPLRGVDGRGLLLEHHASDVHTQWTETRAVFNRGALGVKARIAEIEAALPFAILGFDCDNGGEFLNWHLVDYFGKRPRSVPFTRSRPCHKNDNARVEQKNWTHVRQLVGYGRLPEPAQAELLNELYSKEWGWFRNFFSPVMKHLRTEIEGSRKRRVYDTPKTPFERLKDSGQLAPEQLKQLEALYASLNPFDLKRRIEKKLRVLLRAAKGPSLGFGGLIAQKDGLFTNRLLIGLSASAGALSLRGSGCRNLALIAGAFMNKPSRSCFGVISYEAMYPLPYSLSGVFFA